MFFRYKKISSEGVRPSDEAAVPQSFTYGLLRKDSELNWVIQKDPDNPESVMIIPDPDKKYAFVMMPNKEIRIMPADSNDSPHLEISQYSNRVGYAGEVFFDFDEDYKPMITRWNNHSPVYSSSPDLISQTGLPEDKFDLSSTNSSAFK